MLYGRRLDQSLQHVDGSRYALVHAVAKRARQITLWLTADPAELRAEAAPPPAPGELTSRDPVALAEVEILDGEVKVRWDPEGLADERELLEDALEADPLLLDGIGADDDLDRLEDDAGTMTPALAQVLEGEATADDAPDDDDDADEADDEAVVPAAEAEVPDLGDDSDDLEEVSLDEVGESEDIDDEDEDL
jgi:DNA-directed RNA polymerase subunit K/omega